MNTRLLLVIQAVLSGLQVVNVSLATMQDVPGWVSLTVAAVVAAGQSLIQHAGNQTVPGLVPADPPKANAAGV